MEEMIEQNARVVDVEGPSYHILKHKSEQSYVTQITQPGCASLGNRL